MQANLLFSLGLFVLGFAEDTPPSEKNASELAYFSRLIRTLASPKILRLGKNTSELAFFLSAYSYLCSRGYEKIAILCLLLVGALPALAGSYRPTRFPMSSAWTGGAMSRIPDGILSRGSRGAHRLPLRVAARTGLAQVAVVAVDDIAGGDAFSVRRRTVPQLGRGSAESDNGLGILLVKELREYASSRAGGLEGILPDALCKRIQLNYMLPAFREGDYSAGMVAGVEAAAAVLEGGEADLSGDGGELPAWMIFVIVVGFIVGPAGTGAI